MILERRTRWVLPKHPDADRPYTLHEVVALLEADLAQAQASKMLLPGTYAVYPTKTGDNLVVLVQKLQPKAPKLIEFRNVFAVLQDDATERLFQYSPAYAPLIDALYRVLAERFGLGVLPNKDPGVPSVRVNICLEDSVLKRQEQALLRALKRKTEPKPAAHLG